MKLSCKIFSLLTVICLSTATLSTGAGCGILNSGMHKYDELSEADENCSAAWADIDAQLQRRADLIPNLVSVVKGSAVHEEKTLVEVMQARAQATQIRIDPSKGDLDNPEKLKQFQEAQANLKGSLSRLMAVREAYPDLKANRAFSDLQTQIEGTENRILRAREQYNARVRQFNTTLRQLGGKILNPITGNEFKPRKYFEADEASKYVPKVDFNSK